MVDHVRRRDVFIQRSILAILLAGLAVYLHPFGMPPLWAALTGIAVSILFILLETYLSKMNLRLLIGAGLGVLLGGLAGTLIAAAINQGLWAANVSAPFVQIAVVFGCVYLGFALGSANANRINLNAIGVLRADAPALRSLKILDTSVLIDGRIADIAESGFLEGTLGVPEVVIRELQAIADSSETAKRNRGRRGLDVVQRLQKLPGAQVELMEGRFPNIKEVDLKLIEMAKLHRCRIVTNDFNLNKVAQVHGVGVLNINELANALRPVVLPGETMRVFILKEGKEYNQGVAYLDDGTMVVVDNARRYISKNIDIVVTSVLQTTAGKMIFGKHDERSVPGPTPVSGAASASAL